MQSRDWRSAGTRVLRLDNYEIHHHQLLYSKTLHILLFRDKISCVASLVTRCFSFDETTTNHLERRIFPCRESNKTYSILIYDECQVRRKHTICVWGLLRFVNIQATSSPTHHQTLVNVFRHIGTIDSQRIFRYFANTNLQQQHHHLFFPILLCFFNSQPDKHTGS